MIRCPVACLTLRAQSVASARLVVLVPLSSSVPLVKTCTCDLSCENRRVRVQGKRNSFIRIPARIRLCRPTVLFRVLLILGGGQGDWAACPSTQNPQHTRPVDSEPRESIPDGFQHILTSHSSHASIIKTQYFGKHWWFIILLKEKKQLCSLWLENIFMFINTN